MRNKFLLLIVIIPVFSGQVFSKAEVASEELTKEELRSLYEKMEVLVKNGDYEGAEELYVKVPGRKIDFHFYRSFGEKMEKQDKFDRAIEIYERGIEKTGDYSLMLRYAGVLAHGKQDVENALVWYEKASKANPYHGPDIGKEMAAFISYYSDYDYKPLRLFFKITKHPITPYDVRHPMDTAEALRLADKIVSEYPDSKIAPMALHVKGYICEKTAEYSKEEKTKKEASTEAVDSYQRIVEEYPSSTFQLVCHGEGRNYPKGTAIAIEAQRRVAEIYLNRLNEKRKALSAYRAHLRLMQNTEGIDSRYILMAKWMVARVYESLGKYERALTEYSEIASQFPGKVSEGRATLYHTVAERDIKRAEHLSRQKRYDEAIQQYKTVIRDHSGKVFVDWEHSVHFEDYYSYSFLAISGMAGVCLKDMKNPERAITECRDVIRLISELEKEMPEKEKRKIWGGPPFEFLKAKAQYTIGEIYEKELEKEAQALREYEKVLEINNNTDLRVGFCGDNMCKCYATESHKAKSKIEMLRAKKKGRAPVVSIFSPGNEYIWNECYCVVDVPSGKLRRGYWGHMAKKSEEVREKILARKKTGINKIEKRNIKYLRGFEDAVAGEKQNEEILEMLKEN